MTEHEFWAYLEGERKKGKVEIQASSIAFDGDYESSQSGKYMTGHGILPEDYQSLPKDKILSMGKLLFNGNVNLATKEAILIWLAHQPTKDALSILAGYCRMPDDKLRIFAELAYEECLMWNE